MGEISIYYSVVYKLTATAAVLFIKKNDGFNMKITINEYTMIRCVISDCITFRTKN